MTFQVRCRSIDRSIFERQKMVRWLPLESNPDVRLNITCSQFDFFKILVYSSSFIMFHLLVYFAQ